MTQSFAIPDLIYLMKRLRNPEGGCPWDIKQTFATIASSTIEEAYEVVDAIEKGSRDDLKEELGDLLFQVIFYSELGAEEQAFDFKDIVTVLVQKLIRRHPHVFPDGDLYSNAKSVDGSIDVKAQWESIKAAERSKKGKALLLDDIPTALPAMTRAVKLQKRAAGINLDWVAVAPIFDKLQEEISELEDALSALPDEHFERNIEIELGDVLFTVVNISRHLKLDPETALRRSNNKFADRLSGIAQRAAELNLDLSQLSEAQMDELWEEAKKCEVKYR